MNYTEESLNNLSTKLTHPYDNEYFKATLEILQSDIEDLSRWSAYNDDQFNEEIGILVKTLELIKPKTFKEEYEEKRMK